MDDLIPTAPRWFPTESREYMSDTRTRRLVTALEQWMMIAGQYRASPRDRRWVFAGINRIHPYRTTLQYVFSPHGINILGSCQAAPGTSSTPESGLDLFFNTRLPYSGGRGPDASYLVHVSRTTIEIPYSAQTVENPAVILPTGYSLAAENDPTGIETRQLYTREACNLLAGVPPCAITQEADHLMMEIDTRSLIRDDGAIDTTPLSRSLELMAELARNAGTVPAG